MPPAFWWLSLAGALLLFSYALFYQREGRPRMPLSPMAKDLFRVADLDYFRVQFDRDAAGRIVSLSGLYDDGRVEPNPKAEAAGR